MIEQVAEFVKLLAWATLGVFLVAVIIAIVETSLSNSRKRRDGERLREKQNEIIEKTMEEAIHKTITKSIEDAVFGSFKNNKDE